MAWKIVKSGLLLNDFGPLNTWWSNAKDELERRKTEVTAEREAQELRANEQPIRRRILDGDVISSP